MRRARTTKYGLAGALAKGISLELEGERQGSCRIGSNRITCVLKPLQHV